MTYVYILRSVSRPRELHVGMSLDPRRRLRVHNAGCSRSTSELRPWRLVYSEFFSDPAAAALRERQIKRWAKLKKEALARGDIERLMKLNGRRAASRSFA